MLEHVLDSQERPEPMPAQGGDSSEGRKPFVPPAVQEVGGLSRLTLIGGTL